LFLLICCLFGTIADAYINLYTSMHMFVCIYIYFPSGLSSINVFINALYFAASFTVMSAKGLSGLIQLTIHGDSQVDSPIPYILVIIMFGSATATVMYVQFIFNSVLPIYILLALIYSLLPVALLHTYLHTYLYCVYMNMYICVYSYSLNK
jgi:magnesium transporter